MSRIAGVAGVAGPVSVNSPYASELNIPYWYNFGQDSVYRKGMVTSMPPYNSSPVQIVAMGTPWNYNDRLALGENSVGYIRSDGTLWSWGSNGYLQQGSGSTSATRSSPTQIASTSRFTKIAGSNRHFAAIAVDGKLYTWGGNSNGQLGRGTTTGVSAGLAIGAVGSSTWSAVSTGNSNTLAIRSDGSLWSWGDNSNGQLGNNSTVSRSSPVRIGSGTNWSKISCGTFDTMYAIDTDGNLWAWGEGSLGGLGNNQVNDRSSPVQIPGTWTAVTTHIYGGRGISSNGFVYSWGQGVYGSLGNGLGGTIYRSNPVQLSTTTTFESFGGRSSGATGYAITREGVLWAWGDNTSGNFYNTSTVSRSSPIQITSGVLAVYAYTGFGISLWGLMSRINQR